MIIDHPISVNIPALTSLWREAFGDSEEFIGGFMRTAFSTDRSLVVFADGAPIAVLYWFDMTFGEDKVAYLYAIATKKEFRGRGICTELIEHTHALLKSRGYTQAILVPCAPSLYSFYEKLGYKCFAGISEVAVNAADTPEELRKITPAEYALKRRELLPEYSVIEDGVCLDYLSLDADFYAGEDFILAAGDKDGELFGIELLGNEGAKAGILKALGYARGVFRTPGTEKRFAMRFPLVKGAPVPKYFGLAFD